MALSGGRHGAAARAARAALATVLLGAAAPAGAQPADEAAPAAAAAAAAPGRPVPACPPRAPRVRVAVEDPEPTLLGDAGVDALHGRTRTPRTAQVHHLAVTTSRVDWRSEITAHYARAPGGGPVCAVPAVVALHLVHAEHVIRLAREIPEGGCLWREVLAHEWRHVAVNRRALRAAAQRLRTAAEAWAARASARAPEVEGAVAALQEQLRRAIEPALAAMRAERERGHRAIDTRAEYGRLARVCPEDQAVLDERIGSRP
ncbi:hypothetical protein [Caldovatus aquaticus]|uniref:Uncharacterized protein n=1 Tax=Caldovatus aquaticus TaxID=2865671 RepID=A0ABS7F7W1_9PROT|nr:hypothetical protein [Caldovatus aquaticus]MBW8271057.1 hypothetical protein [Caldovatus aquaticus]